TCPPAAPATTFGFGYALAWYGGNVLISARNANGGDGVVYLFDGSSGTLLATLPAPTGSHGQAGYSLAVAGDDVVVGAPYFDDDTGTGFLFPACGHGTPSLREECAHGNPRDGDGCSAACILELCGTAPDPTCLGTPARASSLGIVAASNPGGDKLKWQWTHGAATAADDFGDPLATTPFALCIWDEADAATPHLVRHLRLPAGESCAGRACWASSASGPLRYRDADASPDGFRQLQLTPGPPKAPPRSSSGAADISWPSPGSR